MFGKILYKKKNKKGKYKNMVKEDVMLNNKTGLHARPATEIAKKQRCHTKVI